MKNGGEDKQILLNTLKEYDYFIAEDIEDMEQCSEICFLNLEREDTGLWIKKLRLN